MSGAAKPKSMPWRDWFLDRLGGPSSVTIKSFLRDGSIADLVTHLLSDARTHGAV